MPCTLHIPTNDVEWQSVEYNALRLELASARTHPRTLEEVIVHHVAMTSSS
jgi:hypothetical protein